MDFDWSNGANFGPLALRSNPRLSPAVIGLFCGSQNWTLSLGWSSEFDNFSVFKLNAFTFRFQLRKSSFVD